MTDAMWVVADLHFNHHNIIGFTGRPWADVETMNEGLIERWNDTVGLNDPVWVLGDFGFRNKTGHDLEEIFGRLNGRLHLVVGNHDEQNPTVLQLPWERIEHLCTIRHQGHRAVACHYPLYTWKHPHRYVMLHGHSHGTLPRRRRTYDVGVDAAPESWGWAPIRFEQICAMIEPETYEPVDHHE